MLYSKRFFKEFNPPVYRMHPAYKTVEPLCPDCLAHLNYGVKFFEDWHLPFPQPSSRPEISNEH